jgi:hypothetical protein
MGHDVSGPFNSRQPVGQHTSELRFLIPSDNTFTYLQLRRDNEAALGNIQPHHRSLTLHLRLRNEPRHRIRREP